jgi:hypothetical protein
MFRRFANFHSTQVRITNKKDTEIKVVAKVRKKGGHKLLPMTIALELLLGSLL